MMLGFEPAHGRLLHLGQNHSFELIRRSKECVINIPTFARQGGHRIGNHHGPDFDKFESTGSRQREAKVDR